MQHRLHLSKDKKLHRVLINQPPVILEKKKQLHLQLCASIISQQLSTKVADVIYQRFLALFPHKKPTVQMIIDLPFDQLKSVGLSRAKTNYVRNVCLFFLEQKLTDARLHALEDEQVVELLTEIKGVGRWTVEMILMFSLGREDVFAVDDLGIQQAMCAIYNIDSTDKKEMKQAMLKRSTAWKPYRTYACRYLWGWKDTPVIK